MLHIVYSRYSRRLLSSVSLVSRAFGRLLIFLLSGRHSRRIAFPALALAALLIALASVVPPLPSVPVMRSDPGASHSSTQAHAAPSVSVTATAAEAADAFMAQTQWAIVALHYQRGYSVQGGSWLCYGWPSGAYHCTQHWRRTASGIYVSLNPPWVPSQANSAPASSPASSPAASAPTSFSATPLAHISQWASTGRPATTEPYGTFQGYTWGWCTSGAALLAHDNVRGLGNAADWTRNAAARGLPTGTAPRAGATAVFQPYVQGALGGGHVAHVVAIYAGGWFLVEETNFIFAGGGFGRLSYRYAHVGSGVSFIYPTY